MAQLSTQTPRGPYQAIFATLGLKNSLDAIEDVVRDLVGDPYSRALDACTRGELIKAAHQADSILGA